MTRRVLLALLLLAVPALPDGARVTAVDSIGITVSDLDRSVDFYTRVLTFEKVAETEVTGEDYERLQGVFGLRMRVARLRLGEEFIELTEYLAPRGRPIPVDSRSNDRRDPGVLLQRPRRARTRSPVVSAGQRGGEVASDHGPPVSGH
jgi:catechol 2,3-dioxygenase-like lactoylglutathione lyase family enzyme